MIFYMDTFSIILMNLSMVLLQGGIPSNPYPPIEGSLSPGATHKTSGERWETTLTVKDMDTWLDATGRPTIVCNPNSYVVPVIMRSHEPTAQEVLTRSAFVNCTWTYIHSKVALILPPGSPEKLFIDEYWFTDDNPQVPGGGGIDDVTNDDVLVLRQQVWIKGAPPTPPTPPGGGG